VVKTFRCTIVTPARAVFDEEVTYVSFPAWDGQQGVMNGQSPLLTELGIGALRVEREGGPDQWFLVDGGFAQINEGVLTILTEQAAPAGELAAKEARAALKEANAAALAGGEDRDKVEAAQQRARARLQLALEHGHGEGE
jgi:F-type H+-transporting ATPase subunit epsilon